MARGCWTTWLFGLRWDRSTAAFIDEQIVKQAEYQSAQGAIHNGIERAYHNTAEASTGVVTWIDRSEQL